MTFKKTPKSFKAIQQLRARVGSKNSDGFADYTTQYISSSLTGLFPVQNLHPFDM